MDWKGREERVRDSGIADIPALDDIIADETLDSIDEGDKFRDANDPDMPYDPPAAGAVGGAAAAAEPIVTPPQLQSLPAFDGKRGEGFINWIETLETARVTYRWPLNALVQVAKAKGGSAVAE